MIKSLIKWAILGSLSISLLLPNTIKHAYGLSKTPNLGSGIVFEPIQNFEFPEDYPQDIFEHFQENIDARSYVVIDQETNKVLAAGDANTPYPIASMTKILSAYLILEAIDEGKLSLDQTITIPSEIVENISSNIELSNAWLVEDVEYPVEDLLYAIMLQSANDATSALMWEIYGNEQSAVQAMIDQLHEWNITNFGLYSTSGAPNMDVPRSFWMPGSNEFNQNTMSAADVALMAKHVIEEHPEILEITQTPEYMFMEGTDEAQLLVNPNELLEDRAYARENVTGLKSGFTFEAGRNFTATGSQDGRDYIAVAMGVFGEGMSSYWEIEILLDKLHEYPDLYQLDLPINLHSPRVDELDPLNQEDVQGNPITNDTSQETDDVETTTEFENQRDNPITNFMRDVFNLFN